MKRPSGKNTAVTMRDVATQSGFSPATVSIVLNNAPLARYIAPATKKRIEEVARKLGYRPNAMARFLRSKRTHSVGVMFFDITDPFCTTGHARNREFALSGFVRSDFRGRAQPAKSFRAISRDAAGTACRSADRGRQLAVRRHSTLGRSRETQHSRGDDWLGIAGQRDQFGDGR